MPTAAKTSGNVLKPGSKAPRFRLPVSPSETVGIDDFKGEALVLYFYPKDDTPGCTKEACDFRDNMTALKRLKAKVVGISKDSVAKHEKFIKKYDLNFPLASDEEGRVCEDYGVWVEKSMYGKKYMGIERSTFLIDGKGMIRALWRGVKVDGHVDEIVKALKDMKD